MENKNAGYHVKEHEKLYQKPSSKVTLHFVWGHLSRKQTVDVSIAYGGLTKDQFHYNFSVVNLAGISERMRRY